LPTAPLIRTSLQARAASAHVDTATRAMLSAFAFDAVTSTTCETGAASSKSSQQCFGPVAFARFSHTGDLLVTGDGRNQSHIWRVRTAGASANPTATVDAAAAMPSEIVLSLIPAGLLSAAATASASVSAGNTL
jgi:hypothetical protein